MEAKIIPFKPRPAEDDPYRLFCSYWLDIYRMSFRAMWWWAQ